MAGRPYVLNASSEEHARKIRVSADEINKKVNAYLDKFPGKSIVDILSFVALNVCMNNLTLQEQINNLSDEEKALAEELGGYLENIGKKSNVESQDKSQSIEFASKQDIQALQESFNQNMNKLLSEIENAYRKSKNTQIQQTNNNHDKGNK